MIYLKVTKPYWALDGPFPNIKLLERYLAHKVAYDVPFHILYSAGYEIIKIHDTPEIWELKAL